MRTGDKILIGILCVIIGILIALQYRTVQFNYLDGLIPSKRSDQLRTEITALREDKARLSQELADRERELNDITTNADTEITLIKNMQLQLERYKTICGLTDVAGEGVYIYIDNGIAEMGAENTANIVENTYLITAIVNELNAAGAEAISVNDQRIIGGTAIRQVGDEISINGKKFINPIVIKAIGNKDVLLSAVGARFQIVESLQNSGYQVEIKDSDSVKIGKYEDVINWRYAITEEQ